MANIKKLIPHILRWEGGFVNDPHDRGGATNKGITLHTYRQFFGESRTVGELIDITDEEWEYILRRGYWDTCRADAIESQSVANMIVDWAWGSGPRTVIKQVQRVLGTTADGVVGPNTLRFINAADPRELFDALREARAAFYHRIALRDPTQERFLKGWLNRLGSLKFADDE